MGRVKDLDIEIFDRAVKKYGECMYSLECQEYVKSYLMETYQLSREKAIEYVDCALDRLADDYCV